MGRYVVAAGLARLADEMVGLAVVLLVLARTGQPALAGAVVTAYTLPALVSGPLLGAWLDRTRYRRIVLAANQAVLAAAALGLVWTVGGAPAAVPVTLAAAAGVTLPLTSAGFTSLVPRLAAGSRTRANTLDALTFNTAAIAGPALAGVLAAAGGAAFATSAVAAIALGGLVATLTLSIPRADEGTASGGLWRTMATGLRYLVRVPRLRGATLTTVLGHGSVGALSVALPLFAADIGAGHDAAGLVWAALEAGAILGTLAVARLASTAPPHRVVFAGTAGFGVALALWPLADSLWTVSLWTIVALAALAGLPHGPVLPAIFAVRQRYAPAGLLAQVATTGASLKIGAYALGATLGGVLVGRLGPAATIAVVAAAQPAAAGLGWLAARRPVESAPAVRHKGGGQPPDTDGRADGPVRDPAVRAGARRR